MPRLPCRADEANVCCSMHGAPEGSFIRLALIDAEAQHRLAQHRSHFNPNQPRASAGNPDGGQWTRAGASRIGPQLAGGGKPPLGLYHLLFAIAARAAKLLIEDYRSKNRTDLFGQEAGAVVVCVVDGVPIAAPAPGQGDIHRRIVPQQKISRGV